MFQHCKMRSHLWSAVQSISQDYTVVSPMSCFTNSNFANVGRSDRKAVTLYLWNTCSQCDNTIIIIIINKVIAIIMYINCT